MLTLVPVAPPIAVSDSIDYEAFPGAVRLPDGGYLLGHSAGDGHVSGSGRAILRRSADGLVWSKPIVYHGPDPGGYGWSAGGFAFDPDGRRLWMTPGRARATGPASATGYESFLTSSTDEGRTWSPRIRLPELAPARTLASCLVVLDDGTLLLSMYTAAVGQLHASWVLASTDGGVTWPADRRVQIPAPRSTNNAPRHSSEPQLAVLPDGRIACYIRSDNPPFYSYLYGTVSSDGGRTWPQPQVVLAFASGLPALTLFPDPLGTGTDVLACLYRGWLDVPRAGTSVPVAFPPRICLADASRPLELFAERIEVTPGDHRRHLYGLLTPSERPDEVIMVWSAEEDEINGQRASIYAQRLRFARVPSVT
jgi:BNR repeat-like domain